MTIWTPTTNTDHRVNIVDPEDRNTWIVLRGTKSVVQLITEDLENPNRQWLNPAGQQLPDAAKQGLITSYKARYRIV